MFRLIDSSSVQIKNIILVHSVSVHSRNIPVLCFVFGPDDGFDEPKHVAEFLILITNIYICVCVVLLPE